MLCGSLAGQLVGGVFVHNPGCAVLPQAARQPRCCRCGGTLLKEPDAWGVQSEAVSDVPTAPAARLPVTGKNLPARWGPPATRRGGAETP